MKKFFYVLITLIGCCIIMSCDNMSNSNKDNNNINPNTTVLKVLDTSNMNINQEIWDKFQKENPDIVIEREVIDIYNQFFRKLNDLASVNQLPDVFALSADYHSDFICKRKFAKDLMPFIERDGIKEKYNPICMDPNMHIGGYLAELPLGLNTSLYIVVNTKLLNDLGLNPATTYEELKAQVPVLQKAGKKLILMGNKDIWVMQGGLFSTIVGRFGGSDWTKDIFENKVKFYPGTNTPFYKAVYFIKQMYDDGVLSKDSLNTNYNEAKNQFVNEEGAYIIDVNLLYSGVNQKLSSDEKLVNNNRPNFDLDIIQFPTIPGENYHKVTSGWVGNGYGMSAAIKTGSKKEEAAWRLIKWLSRPEIQQMRFNKAGFFPSWKGEIDFSKNELFGTKFPKWINSINFLSPVFDNVFPIKVSNVLNNNLYSLANLSFGNFEDVNTVCKNVQSAYDACK